MAVQDQYNHPITWEEKKYFNNTSSVGTDKVTAKYTVAPDGRPEPQCLTKLGLEHFGYNTEAPKPSKNESKPKKEKARSSSDDDDNLGCLWTIVLTIIPVLPIWWLVRLPFTMGWGILQFFWSMLTLPFRAVLSSDSSVSGGLNLPKYRDKIM